MRRKPHVPAYDLHKVGIALGSPDCRQVPDHPENKPCDPQAQAQADGGRQRTVEDGDRSWCACEQDRLRERAVDWRLEAGNELMGNDIGHQMSAPPAKEKKDRKKDEAANAIDRPKTI